MYLLQNSFTAKHARLTKRNVESYDDVDSKIIFHLQKLEAENEDLWTSPEYNKKDFVESIFQYPAMMVPEVQRQIIDVIFRSTDSESIKNMIDPFMGSSTSLISSMHYGVDCYGQDINPLAILISKVRTSLINLSVKYLSRKLNNFIDSLKLDQSEVIEVEFRGIDKWFKEDVSIEISKILRKIREEEDIEVRRFYWVNLAEVIRICSNDRTSTFKLHSRPLFEIESRTQSPIKNMEKQLRESIDGVSAFKSFLRRKGRLKNNKYQGTIHIGYGDSCKSIEFNGINEAFAELLVSSPPYGDNHTTVTYGQYSFLPLNWIDLKDIDEKIDPTCLNTTAEIDNRSVGGLKRHPEIKRMATSLVEMSTTFRNDFSSFSNLDNDKFNKIVIFLHDLNLVIDHSLKALKTNSYMVWTIGNRNVGNLQVNNIQYMKEFLVAKNCQFVHSITRNILNKRMAKKNKVGQLMNTEEILILRKK